MKHILLLTDFSESAKNATNYALQLFQDQASCFYILHIPQKSVYTTSDLMAAGTSSIYNSLVKKAKTKLDKYVKTLESNSRNKKISFETIVDYDVLTDSVNQIISSKKIDLIVMGTNGVTGAKEVVFGSNTINVIRKVDCATLVIPKGFQYKKPHTLFLPLDQTDSLNSKAFLKLLSYVKTFKTSLDVVRVIPQDEGTPEAQDQEHLKTNLKDTTFEYQLVKNKNIHEVVAQYLNKNKADLMALLVQKETAFERFLTASDTKKISDDLKVPLFIFHSH